MERKVGKEGRTRFVIGGFFSGKKEVVEIWSDNLRKKLEDVYEKVSHGML